MERVWSAVQFVSRQEALASEEIEKPARCGDNFKEAGYESRKSMSVEQYPVFEIEKSALHCILGVGTIN